VRENYSMPLLCLAGKLPFKKCFTTPLLLEVFLVKIFLRLLALSSALKCDLSIPPSLPDTQKRFPDQHAAYHNALGQMWLHCFEPGEREAFCSCLGLKACRVTAAQTPWRSSRGKWKTTVSGPHKCSMSHRKEPRTCRTH